MKRGVCRQSDPGTILLGRVAQLYCAFLFLRRSVRNANALPFKIPVEGKWTMSKTHSSKFWARVDAAIDVFMEKYPQAFLPKDSVETKPLRIGVFTRLTAENPDIPRGIVAEALKRYTLKDRYLRALLTCQDRVELDGSSFQPVLDHHREYALKLLSDRQQKQVAREAA